MGLVERQGATLKFTFCYPDGVVLLACSQEYSTIDKSALVFKINRIWGGECSLWYLNLCLFKGECLCAKNFNLLISCLFNNRDSNFLETVTAFKNDR